MSLQNVSFNQMIHFFHVNEKSIRSKEQNEVLRALPAYRFKPRIVFESTQYQYNSYGITALYECMY